MFRRAFAHRNFSRLASLQAGSKGRTRVTIMPVDFVIEAFREMAEADGTGQRTL